MTITMFFFFYLLLFIFGAAVGSFLGVLVDRLMHGETIWKGRSHCDHCRHVLHPFDLVPVASFFVLNKKCRYCHKSLSWFYPIIEILTGVVFTLVVYSVTSGNLFLLTNSMFVILLAYYLLLSSAFLVIFFTDLKFGIIPFKVVFFALGVTLIWYLLLASFYVMPGEFVSLGLQTNILSGLEAAVGAFAFFFLLFIITRGRGMGFGDVVYAFLMGFVLGFPNIILALYIAFLSGAIISVLLVLLNKKRFKGGTIPFGPFLVAGTMVSLLWGNTIIANLLRFLGQ